MTETAKRRHGGFYITFDPRSFLFNVDGDDWPSVSSFKSLEEATKAIDEHHAAEAKLLKANAKLNIRLLTEEGNGVDITSINRATGMVSGPDYKPVKSTGYSNRKMLYPDLLWVKYALAKERSLYKEWQDLKATLSEIEVNASRGYGTISAAHYQNYLTKLEAEVKAAYAKAEAMPVKNEEAA